MSDWDLRRDWLIRQLTICVEEANTLAEITGLAFARAHARNLVDALSALTSTTTPEASPEKSGS